MRHEDYLQHLLNAAPETDIGGRYYSLIAFKESDRFGIPEVHIRQMATEMYDRRLISLTVFDGREECTLQEWRSRGLDEHTFFYNTTRDCNQVRVRLLVLGAMHRQNLKKNRIGFQVSQNLTSA